MDAMPNYWDNPNPAQPHPLEDAKSSEFERTYAMFEHLSLLVENLHVECDTAGYRVVLGPYSTREQAEETGRKIGMPSFVVSGQDTPDR